MSELAIGTPNHRSSVSSLAVLLVSFFPGNLMQGVFIRSSRVSTLWGEEDRKIIERSA